MNADFDDTDDELKMEVRGSLDTKKYYNFAKYAMQSKKRVTRTYGKLCLVQIRSGGS
jgi:hypothetical protein